MFPVINEACRVVEEVRPVPLPAAKPAVQHNDPTVCLLHVFL